MFFGHWDDLVSVFDHVLVKLDVTFCNCVLVVCHCVLCDQAAVDLDCGECDDDDDRYRYTTNINNKTNINIIITTSSSPTSSSSSFVI